jgi:hypothetical protein
MSEQLFGHYVFLKKDRTTTTKAHNNYVYARQEVVRTIQRRSGMCKIRDCEKPHYREGYCNKHFRSWINSF